MTSKVYDVTDLGPGDGGKGGVVHKIATMMNAHTVIKRGGAQGSHGVRTSKGESFNFSQWGCGTFEGIPTHISSQFIVTPEGLLNEANQLRYGCCIHNPFSLLTIDETALCATPFHGIASRLKEMARGNNPRGTIGTGVGEAYRGYKIIPEIAIKARDLKESDLKERLMAIRDYVQQDLQSIIHGEFLESDREESSQQIALLFDDRLLEYVYSRFMEVVKLANIVDHDYFGDVILSKEGVAVVESSHGILTDREMGFHPHTSAIRTLPCFTHSMLKEAGFEGQVVNIGVTRAYAIRHGAGPMPTADLEMSEKLLPGSNKCENRYQGKVRVGPMDLMLLRYAIESCGGPSSFDGLAISWFDQIKANGSWGLCNKYLYGNDDLTYFKPSGDIMVDFTTGDKHIEHQANLTKQLFDCVPQVNQMLLNPSSSNDVLYDVCAAILKDTVEVPVRMMSFGATELDKICK